MKGIGFSGDAPSFWHPLYRLLSESEGGGAVTYTLKPNPK